MFCIDQKLDERTRLSTEEHNFKINFHPHLTHLILHRSPIRVPQCILFSWNIVFWLNLCNTPKDWCIGWICWSYFCSVLHFLYFFLIETKYKVHYNCVIYEPGDTWGIQREPVYRKWFSVFSVTIDGVRDTTTVTETRAFYCA